uniref:NADH dehydrogenase subunit 2 n=1 Tax=Hydroides elegans TaxID=216498 RepID=UPI001FA7E62D|nr:NADH dehydrogenase subunit 2 [Hydroides elegans]UNA71674.1 NADH dehydrogenase subunit 2 [Hydroides elegans]
MGSVAPAYLMSIIMTLASVFLGLFSSSIFMFWLSMELSVCSFCGVLSFIEKSSGGMIAKYFIISAFSGVVFLCGLLLDWSGALSEGWEDSMIIGWIFFMCMYVKLGLPPFHFWVVGVVWGCTWFSAALLLTLQKMLPFLAMSTTVGFSGLLIPICLLSSVLASLGGLNHYEPYYLIAYASMITSNWLVVVSFFSLNIFFLSMALYSFVIFMLLFSFREKSWGIGFTQFSPWFLMTILLLVGLPNGPIFMLKVLIYGSLLSFGCLTGSWLIGITSVFLIPLYLRLVALVSTSGWGWMLNNYPLGNKDFFILLLVSSAFVFSGLGWSVVLL